MTENDEGLRNPSRKRKRARTKLARLEAGRQALNAIYAGVPLHQIATQLGYGSKSGVWKAAQAALDETLPPIAEKVRELELGRVDRIVRALWADALGLPETEGAPARTPNLDVLDRLERFLKMRHRLLGIEQRIQLSGELDVRDLSEPRERLRAQIDELAIRRAKKIELMPPAAVEGNGSAT